MAGGLRYKFHGSQVQFVTGFDAESPSGAITGITRLIPQSSPIHAGVGDVVKIVGVVV
jgi:hypothetical protein